jgi:tetratricopeptide (TPR) repeat protein
MHRIFVLSFLLIAPLAAGAEVAVGNDPIAQLARSEADAALRLAKSPRGAVHLIRLQALRDEVADLNILAGLYRRLLEDRKADPTVRALARMFAADIERARGRLNKSAELLKPLGYIEAFYLLGSFDNEGKSGCNIDFGPEAKLDLKASVAAKGHAAQWRKLALSSPDGYIDLAASLRPNREAVGYALTFLQAPAEGRATLALGASGAFRLWINGQLASSSDSYNYPRPDQARVSVRLHKGVNRALLKVCQAAGPFGFYLRREASGSIQTKVALPEVLPPIGKEPGPSAQVLPILATRLQAELQKHPDDALLRGEYATALAFSRAFDESSHTEAIEAERAADTAPSSAPLQLLAAKLQEDDSNLRRRHLEAAVKTDPQSPDAQLQLAQFELSRGHPDRALPTLESLVARHPRFPAARISLIRAYDALGEWPRAAALTEQAFADFPRHPAVVREAARAARRMERVQDAAERFRVALALRYDDANSRRSLMTLLTDMGRTDEAVEEMRLMLRLDPFDNSTRMHLAEVNASNGSADEARRLFEQAKSLSPDEPEVHEREGRALLQLGQQKEALAAFERALQLRPQNPALREAWRLLSGESNTVGLEYAFDASSLVKEADSFAGEDAVYLADYTYVRVQRSGLSSRFQQIAVKVYSQRGVDAFRSHAITYVPDRQEIRVVRARITKPDGSVLESYSESERGMNEPWTGMYYDTRVKVLSFPALAPGDLLELQYQLDDSAHENLLSDYWGDVDYIQTTSPKVRYQYIADMPQGRTLYWNKSRLPPAIHETEDEQRDGRRLYRWTASRVPKVVPEPSMPGWAEVVPTLHVSTYKTWEQVGRYYWGLIRDQLIPNEDVRKAVNQALKDVDRKDELAVVRAIYNFVVTNTRYVALEFGIHGYKPYRVDRVLARRFGDCKDKASLIHAMLEVAGIDSRLVLLRMRNLGSIGDEPASLAAFNHAIAYVPKFDLYLDGTAEFHGSRELPSADRLANVLIIDPKGTSTFGTIPEAQADQNATGTFLEITLLKDGSAGVLGKSIVTGQSAPEYRRSYQAGATRKAIFEQGWAQAFPGLTVQQVSLTDPGKLDEDVTMSYRMDVPRYAEVLPRSLRFYPLGSGRTFTESYAPLSERHYDLLLSGPWVNRYEFVYALPAGFTVPELPADLKEETPFGRVRMWHRIENGRLVCRAEVALTQTRIKTNEYSSFRAFLQRLDQAFARKLVASSTLGQTARK